MPPVPDSSAGPANQTVANDYDSFAEAYSAENETSLANAYYERPAILALAGNVAGRRILDAGCGSGPLSAALRDRGAIVTGIDSSAKMLELARQRLGAGADLHLAISAARCRSPTARSTMSSRPWYCTTWRTGRGRWPNCGGC
jgi:predicted TPR repeat methyltransferase